MSRRLFALGIVLAVLVGAPSPSPRLVDGEAPLGPRVRTWQQVNAMSYPERDELTERLAAVVRAVQPRGRTTFADTYTGASLDLEHERAVIYVTDLRRGRDLLAAASGSDVDMSQAVLRLSRYPRTALYRAISQMHAAQPVFGTAIESMYATSDGLVVQVADVAAGQRGRTARGAATQGRTIEELVGIPLTVERARAQNELSWADPTGDYYGIAIDAANSSGLMVRDPWSPPWDAVTAAAEFDLARHDAPLICGVSVDLDSTPTLPSELPIRLSIVEIAPVAETEVRLDVRFESDKAMTLNTFAGGWRVLVVRDGVLVGASPTPARAGESPTPWGADLVGMEGNAGPGAPWEVSMFLGRMQLCHGLSWSDIAARSQGYELIVQPPDVGEARTARSIYALVTGRASLGDALRISERAR